MQAPTHSGNHMILAVAKAKIYTKVYAEVQIVMAGWEGVVMAG